MLGHMVHYILVDTESEMVLIWINDGGNIRMFKEKNYLRVVIRSTNLKKRMR